MAATRGPVPDRTEQTVRRNIGEPVDKVTAIGVVSVPELGDISYRGETHQLVEDLYQSMVDSAQRRYYEPTDWQFARLALYALNEELVFARQNGKPVGAMKLTALNQMLTSLLLTEGDRRRVRIEVERSGEGGEVLSLEDAFRKKLEGSK